MGAADDAEHPDGAADAGVVLDRAGHGSPALDDGVVLHPAVDFGRSAHDGVVAHRTVDLGVLLDARSTRDGGIAVDEAGAFLGQVRLGLDIAALFTARNPPDAGERRAARCSGVARIELVFHLCLQGFDRAPA